MNDATLVHQRMRALLSVSELPVANTTYSTCGPVRDGWWPMFVSHQDRGLLTLWVSSEPVKPDADAKVFAFTPGLPRTMAQMLALIVRQIALRFREATPQFGLTVKV